MLTWKFFLLIHILVIFFVPPTIKSEQNLAITTTIADYDAGDEFQALSVSFSSSHDEKFHYLNELYEQNKNLPIIKHVQSLNDTMIVVNRLVNLTSKLIESKFNKQQMMTLMEIFYKLNITDNCLISLTKILQGVFNREIWALKFLDALGKIPTGIAEGSISHFGEFDECLEIEHRTNQLIRENRDSDDATIYGRYCLAKFILPYPPSTGSIGNLPLYARHHYDYLLNFLKLYNLDNYLTLNKLVEILNNQHSVTLRLGVCFPTTCRSEEFESLLNQIFYPITKIPIELEPDCYDRQSYVSKAYDCYELSALIIISLLILVNVLCSIWHCLKLTLFDKIQNSLMLRKLFTSSSWTEWILCFSIIQNTCALFDFRQFQDDEEDNQVEGNNGNGGNRRITKKIIIRQSSRRFKCIDVIRLFLVMNVCIDHMFLFPPFMAFMSFKRILNSVITKVYYYNRYFFARNIVIIDAFFIISGLLLSYSFLRKLALTQGRLQYSIFLIRLWLKYSIPMFFVVLLFWLLPKTGDGPIWNIGMSMMVQACKEPESLLSSFTYLSNYRIKPSQNIFNFGQRFALCNPPTWFLSALFQLQILGPLFILLIYRYANFGLGLNILIVFFGCYTSILPDLLFGQRTYFEGSTFSSLEEMTKAFVAFHMGINQYVISFFLGIILGYLIIRQQLGKQSGSSNIWIKTVLWVVSIISLSSVIYWFMTLHRINEAPPRISVLLWFSLGKLIGCLSIGWMLYELCIGQAIIIEKIFSLSLFQFLSRLSFGIYLLHFLPLANRLFTVRDTYVMTDKLLFEFILVDFIQTSVMASIFYVIIERPFNNLTSMIFAKLEPSPPSGLSKINFGYSPSEETTLDEIGSSVQNNNTNSNENTESNQSPLGSLTQKMIQIEIQDLKLTLPQINLYAANCGDFQNTSFHYHNKK